MEREASAPTEHAEGSGLSSADLAPESPTGGGPGLALLAELEHADELDLESRLLLLRRVESTIASSLEGLDGL